MHIEINGEFILEIDQVTDGQAGIWKKERLRELNIEPINSIYYYTYAQRADEKRGVHL
jgi:hypothetical protein